MTDTPQHIKELQFENLAFQNLQGKRLRLTLEGNGQVASFLVVCLVWLIEAGNDQKSNREAEKTKNFFIIHFFENPT